MQAGGGAAGVARGWAAASLALGTRLAVRSVGAGAGSVRRGGVAGGGRSVRGLAATAPGPVGPCAAAPGRAARPPRVPRGRENQNLPTS